MRFITEITNRRLLALTGADQVSFLQGLISNDVAKLSTQPSLYAAFLSAQGKFQHDFILHRDGEAVLLAVETERWADLVKKLTLYKLRAAVTIVEIAAGAKIFALWGDTPPTADGLIPDPRLPALGWRVISDKSLDTLASYYHATIADFAAFDYHRASLGVPDGSRDLPIDRAILLENGFDELRGIDWDKGCYLGQELTARTRYRGLVRKRLLPCFFATAPADSILAETPIQNHQGRDCGEVRSFYRGVNGAPDVALVMLRLEALHPESSFTINGQSVRVVTPDWLRLPAADTA